jgi:hypothetical protein
MIHWIASPSLAGARPASIALPGDPALPTPSARGSHALMLAYAAQRRRAAARNEARYWKVAAPHAVDRARQLRERMDFAVLP